LREVHGDIGRLARQVSGARRVKIPHPRHTCTHGRFTGMVMSTGSAYGTLTVRTSVAAYCLPSARVCSVTGPDGMIRSSRYLIPLQILAVPHTASDAATPPRQTAARKGPASGTASNCWQASFASAVQDAPPLAAFIALHTPRSRWRCRG
jgi:hypothetical protein